MIMRKEVQYKSSILKEVIDLKIITPTESNIEKVLIFLHGKLEPERDCSLIEKMFEDMDVNTLTEKYKMAIVTPCMGNQYYIDLPSYKNSLFLADELPEAIKKICFVNSDVEILIGGISMGGYGAVLCSAISGKFDRIISISGSYIQDDIMIGNSEVWGRKQPTVESTEGTFLKNFLPVEDLERNIYKNVVPALDLFGERKQMPYVVMTCGTNDWLYTRNKKFEDELIRRNIKHIMIEILGGNHDTDCFKEGLWEAMKVLCPQNE